MKNCECLNECPFFNDKMKDTDGLGGTYKQKYCRGNNLDCARFQVFKQLGKEYLPADLYPNMNERATRIITRSVTFEVPTKETIDDAIRNMFAPVGAHR